MEHYNFTFKLPFSQIPFFLKIFHLNGCGPNHKDCGQNPAPGSKFYNDTKSQFIHMDMQVIAYHRKLVKLNFCDLKLA